MQRVPHLRLHDAGGDVDLMAVGDGGDVERPLPGDAGGVCQNRVAGGLEPGEGEEPRDDVVEGELDLLLLGETVEAAGGAKGVVGGGEDGHAVEGGVELRVDLLVHPRRVEEVDEGAVLPAINENVGDVDLPRGARGRSCRRLLRLGGGGPSSSGDKDGEDEGGGGPECHGDWKQRHWDRGAIARSVYINIMLRVKWK